MKRLSFLLIALFGFWLILSGCGKQVKPEPKDNDYQKVRMVMTVNGTDIGIETLVARRLADILDKESGGNVRLEVYTDDQLAGGNTTRATEMIADGSVDLAAYPSCSLAVLDERLSVAAIPWAFSSYQEARQVIDETGGAFYAKVLSEHGLIYLGSTHNGMRQLSNNLHRVRTPDDIKHMKIRVMGGDLYLRFFGALGAKPTPMGWTELPVALEQGVVDGQENGIYLTSTAHLNKFQKYMTIWNYTYENYIFVANTKTFNMLEPKTQKLIMTKTKEACEWGRDKLEADEQSIKERFAAGGMDIIELTADELEPFKERIKPIINQMKQKYGAEACAAFQIP